MRYHSFVLVSILLPLTISLSSCGKKIAILKGVDVESTLQGGHDWVTLDAVLSLGSLKLPGAEIGIQNPKTGVPMGTVTYSALQDGTSQVGLSIDLTQASQLDPRLGTSLPNARELPASLGVGTTSIIGIPISTESRVYVGGSLSADLYLGIALGIPALDSVTGKIPLSLNLFLPVPFSAQVLGVGGLYTSSVKGENGIGIFVRKTAVSANKPTTPAVTSVSEVEHVDTLTALKLNRLMGTLCCPRTGDTV